MRDEEYRPEQIAAYGAKEQPAVAARTGQHLRTIRVGNLLAALALLAAGLGVFSYPDFAGTGEGRAWAVTLLVCAALMLLICTLQHVLWVRATRVWRDQPTISLRTLIAVSWIAHLVSYAVVLVAIAATIGGVVVAGLSATASVLLMGSLALTVAAQALAGVQHVRPSGPPGTVPAHMRRLVARENG